MGGSMRPAGRGGLVREIVGDLHGMFQAIERYSKRSLRECGLTGPQIWALRVLREAGSLTVGGLAARMYMHISSASNLLNRIEAKRFIVRRRDDADQRIVRLAITPAGRRVASRRPAPPRSRLPQALKRMPTRELREMHRAVRRIGAIMKDDGG